MNELLVLLGTVRAARAALTSATVIPNVKVSDVPLELEQRMAAIDEELRKLARDIARVAGV